MSVGAETMVRMGELAVSQTPGEVLVSIGLGSCIGLALMDSGRGLAGLAHIMLPGGGTREANEAGSAKYADVAVERLVEELVALGARLTELEGILVGGAQMFAGGGSSLDIGSRNEEATRAALAKHSVPVRAAATAGNKGRTVRVQVSPASVQVKEAGGVNAPLFP
jgi:chemotaxis protein CheD